MNVNEEEFNRALGRRLSIIRQKHGMSLEALGAQIGVKGQQIFKYETGENRIPPERLALCAHIFRVSVGYFFGEAYGVRNEAERELLTIAGEIKNLPKDIKQLFYILSKKNQSIRLLMCLFL